MGFFTNIAAKATEWLAGLGLPSYIVTLVDTMFSSEGQILDGLVVSAAQDVITGGLTSASFSAAVKDISAKLVAQNVVLGTQTVYAALNSAVAASAPAAVAPVAPAPAA